MALRITTAGLLALATLSAAAPNQADRLTVSGTRNLFLPPQPTDPSSTTTTTNNNNNKNNDNLWASVITRGPSATEYLVACETAFAQPQRCDGAFTGVTLTQGAHTMGVEVGGATYECEFDDEEEDGDAVCEVKEAGDASAKEMTLGSTAVTIVTGPTGVPELRSLEEVARQAVNMAKSGGSSGGHHQHHHHEDEDGSGGGGSTNDDDGDNNVADGDDDDVADGDDDDVADGDDDSVADGEDDNVGDDADSVADGEDDNVGDDDSVDDGEDDIAEDDDDGVADGEDDNVGDDDSVDDGEDDIVEDDDDGNIGDDDDDNTATDFHDDDEVYHTISDDDENKGSASLGTPASIAAFAAALGVIAIVV
ncbi:hypothetical protein ACO1O0_000084 [Amphichorda felina]